MTVELRLRMRPLTNLPSVGYLFILVTGSRRKCKVLLDENQYQQDVNAKKAGDVYSSFNVLVRRTAGENNFKAVLETIRDLMQSLEWSVPEWLHDVFLGYGDRASANFTHLSKPILSMNYLDTFIDWEHLNSSFPDMVSCFIYIN